jgi:putative oxidoreductase
MILQFLDRYRNLGLLILRVGLGLYMALSHGWGKITGGPETWTGLGGTMDAVYGIGFLPAFWGFMAAVAEFVGGLLVVAGLLFRPALLVLIINMGTAALAHATGAIEGGPESALVYGIAWLALVFTGPGRYSLDATLGDRGGASRPRGAGRL